MIDPYAFFQFNRHDAFTLRPLGEVDTMIRDTHHIPHRHPRHHHGPPPPPPPPPFHGPPRGPPPGFPGPPRVHPIRVLPVLPPPPPPAVKGTRWNPGAVYVDIQDNPRPGEAEQVKLSDEELLMCVPFVRGYSFKSKEWGKSPPQMKNRSLIYKVMLNIKDLKPIEWTDDLFKNLVLPEEEKDLLLALARSHAKMKSTFDDFVVGKGTIT